MASFRLSQTSQLVSFVASLFSMLTAGSLYGFSMYSNELALTLGWNQKQLATLVSCGNYGNYLTAPFFGMLVERLSPRLLVILGGSFLTLGYVSISQLLPTHPLLDISSPAVPFPLFVLAFIFIGAGSAVLYITPLSVNVKNVSLDWKGIVVGMSVSCFGLCALVMSCIKTKWFPQDTKSFLLTLGILAAIVNIVASFGIKVIRSSQHLEQCSQVMTISPSSTSTSTTTFPPPPNESTPLMSSSNFSHSTISAQTISVHSDTETPCVYKKGDSWLLFILFSLTTGCGLMYINNIGTMVYSLMSSSQTMTAIQPTGWTASSISEQQGFQVGMLSLFNCIGRLFTGFAADGVLKRLLTFRQNRKRLEIPESLALLTQQEEVAASLTVRGCILTLAVTTMLLGQYLSGRAKEVGLLLDAGTILVGFAYGSAFATAPALASDMWGTNNFGVNWGFMTVGTGIGGHICNTIFGIIYDSHLGHSCKEGALCYSSSFFMTLLLCSTSIFLSALLTYRLTR